MIPPFPTHHAGLPPQAVRQVRRRKVASPETVPPAARVQYQTAARIHSNSGPPPQSSHPISRQSVLSIYPKARGGLAPKWKRPLEVAADAPAGYSKSLRLVQPAPASSSGSNRTHDVFPTMQARHYHYPEISVHAREWQEDELHDGAFH